MTTTYSDENEDCSREWTASKWDWPLQGDSQTVTVLNSADKFQVGLQVCYFGPKEIEVKVCGDNLVIHCKQEESPENMNREILRAYKLPSDVDETTLRSNLTQKGILLISASKRK